MDSSISTVALPEFDLFSTPPYQTSVSQGLYTEYRPISTILPNTDLEFVINSANDEYIQLNETLLKLKFQLKLSLNSGTAIVNNDWDDVGFTNYVLHSLFESIVLTLGNKQTTLSLTTYPYRAYIETLLGLNKDVKKSHLTSALWEESDTKLTDNIEEYYKKFTKYIKPNATSTKQNESNIIELMGKLHLDLCNQNRAIIGGTNIHLRFIPKEPNFFLKCGNTSGKLIKFDILDASIKVFKKKVTLNLLEAHDEALKLSPAIYPITRNDVKSFTINSGLQDVMIDNVANGQLPRRIFVGLVSNAAFNGSLTKNPFNFQTYNLNFIACYLNGVIYPSKPYSPDYDNGYYINEYLGLYQATNQLYNESTLHINRDEYIKGYTLYGFNFAPDMSDDYQIEGFRQIPSNGSLRMELHFKNSLTETVNLIVYYEYDNMITITRERNVASDFA